MAFACAYSYHGPRYVGTRYEAWMVYLIVEAVYVYVCIGTLLRRLQNI